MKIQYPCTLKAHIELQVILRLFLNEDKILFGALLCQKRNLSLMMIPNLQTNHNYKLMYLCEILLRSLGNYGSPLR